MRLRTENIRYWLTVLMTVGLSALTLSCQLFSFDRHYPDSQDADSHSVDTGSLLAPCQENVAVITLVAGELEGLQSCEYAEKK